MKGFLKLVLFLFFSISAMAQNRANIWYFGYGAGLDFNQGNPTALTNGQLYTNEGSASISDNSGRLLFYTDGVVVYNKTHSIMQNGSELDGDSSSTHSAIIVPKPGSYTLYYIFTVDDQHGGMNLRYSVVDMSLDGGLGAIIAKNVLLFPTVPEKVVAYKKANSDEFWVVSQKFNSNEFIAFDITASGINTTPKVSAAGIANGPERRLAGQIKISPDGTKLAIATGWEIQVFNFNEVTGEITDPITLLNNENSYGIEFSPNSSLLYVAYYQGVAQFDLTAGNEEDIEDSRVVLITAGDSFGSLQLGPNNKIYGVRVQGEYLSVINNPDKPGLECNYVYDGVYLEGKQGFLGLPTFISNIFTLEGDIVYENTCLGESTAFSFKENVDSLVWNFGDPSSGVNNTSEEINPAHSFTKEGTFNVTTTVTIGTHVETISTQVTISAQPVVPTLPNLFACEDSTNPGFSSNFNTSYIQDQIAGNQENILIKYYDGNGVQLPSPLPNPMTNSTKDVQQITVRAFSSTNDECFSEKTFKLIVQPLPDLGIFADLQACGDGNGFSSFDLTSLKSVVVAGDLKFYDSNHNLIENSSLSNYKNIVPDLDLIYIRHSNTTTGCYSEKSVKLIVAPVPVAYSINNLTGCDDNNDGISEFFDTTNINSQVLGNQTSMEVSYYTESGELMPGSLPNPYTNVKADRETITVRVTNTQSGCYSETTLNLVTSSQPLVNQPATLYACDSGNGRASFNTSALERELTGNQTGLLIFYYDENGNEIINFAGPGFTNTVPYEQLITARVEDPNNTACATEITFSLKTVSLPEINLDDHYEICSMGESLELKADPAYSSWTWFGPQGNIISDGPGVTISEEGIYGLSVLEEKNGIVCEIYKEFELVHSEAPAIENIKFSNFSTDSNVEVQASGAGVFEYSLDGINFQASNFFTNVAGGTYLVTVRDVNGCGEASKTINLLNYPRFFTPNDDGHNERWHVKGISKSPDALVLIYDRYGKLLKQLSSGGDGWDGTFNGRNMPPDDYWFRLNLEDGTFYSGHFSIVR